MRGLLVLLVFTVKAGQMERRISWLTGKCMEGNLSFVETCCCMGSDL